MTLLKDLLKYPDSLPIVRAREELVDALQSHQVLIIAGETGSGKSTQLPKFCVEAGFGRKGKIACTQPRRVAATSLARRLTEELDTELGQEIGYKIRFQDKTSVKTCVQFMTDGVLLSEIRSDRQLRQYEVIIIDEAHERSLNIDFLLGYLKQLLPKRPELKLLITSANLDLERLSKAFSNAPVFNIEGKSFPVKVNYRPIDTFDEEQDFQTVEDAVVQVSSEVLSQTWDGDLLVFMPGEREIREVKNRLVRLHSNVDVLPLFSRLSQKEQERIFHPGSKRRVIIATNIAETSLTLPRIRYVIDSGLVRVSRFSSRSRTQHLKVEFISQSSANQRKGRAGRLEAGVCIRLYSEEKLQQAAEHTDPEILRSSLAEVILRMLDLRFGNVERFSFVDKPSHRAINEGYQQLQELGALNHKKQLSYLGQQMAKIPLEPRVSRILLAAKEEHALKEVLVIAAGISIQDPREYPADQENKARQMHKAFVNQDSDFITLLQVWDHYHEQWECLKSESKMRKFCKANFLSFVRMREWRDIHQQLSSLLEQHKDFKVNRQSASYEAIHRSILSGFLSQIGEKKEKGGYSFSGNREGLIFPGSGVYKHGNEWIVAAYLVQTSRLFARMVANIEVEWLEEVSVGLHKKHYSEAHFDIESQCVMAFERLTLFGMTIVPRRRRGYGKINPKEATQLFIREGLVQGNLSCSHEFYLHNQRLQKQMIQDGAKLRFDYEAEVEELAHQFYDSRLYDVFSIHDLNRIIRVKRRKKGLESLFMTEEDLRPAQLESVDLGAYPDRWNLGDLELNLDYQVKSSSQDDGATLCLELDMLPYIKPQQLDWLIPGYREEHIYYLLKGLTKKHRKRLIPLSETAKQISQQLTPSSLFLREALQQYLQVHYQLSILDSEWDFQRVPEYLKVKIQVVDHNKKVIAEGRDAVEVLGSIDQQVEATQHTKAPVTKLKAWEKAEQEWKLLNITTWCFETLPQQIEVTHFDGIPLYGYPGLILDEEGIHRKLFREKEQAYQYTEKALRHLFALVLGSDIAWLDRDLRDLKEFKHAYKRFGELDQLKQEVRESIHKYLFQGPWIETKDEFSKRLETAKIRLKSLWPGLMKVLRDTFEQYQITQHVIQYEVPKYASSKQQELQTNLDRLIHKDFIQKTPFVNLRHLPRYLRSLQKRIERLSYNSEKDDEKWEQISPYQERLVELQVQAQLSESNSEVFDELYWMLEEFKVSIFSPELKTAVPVSAKRLERIMEKLV